MLSAGPAIDFPGVFCRHGCRVRITTVIAVKGSASAAHVNEQYDAVVIMIVVYPNPDRQYDAQAKPWAAGQDVSLAAESVRDKNA